MNKIKYIYILDIMNKNKKYKTREGGSNSAPSPPNPANKADNLQGLSTINITDFITKINEIQATYSSVRKTLETNNSNDPNSSLLLSLINLSSPFLTTLSSAMEDIKKLVTSTGFSALIKAKQDEINRLTEQLKLCQTGMITEGQSIGQAAIAAQNPFYPPNSLLGSQFGSMGYSKAQDMYNRLKRSGMTRREAIREIQKQGYSPNYVVTGGSKNRISINFDKEFKKLLMKLDSIQENVKYSANKKKKYAEREIKKFMRTINKFATGLIDDIIKDVKILKKIKKRK